MSRTLRIKAYNQLLEERLNYELHIKGENNLRVVVINPFADEFDELKRLGISADSCIKVDAYLRIGDEVYFVQVQGNSVNSSREEGMYVRRTSDKFEQDNFVSVVHERLITRKIFTDTLLKIEKITRTCDYQENLGDKLLAL